MSTKPVKWGISEYLRMGVAITGGACIGIGIAMLYQEKAVTVANVSIPAGLVLLIIGPILIGIVLRESTNPNINEKSASVWRGAWRTIGIISVFVLLFVTLGALIYSGLWIWTNVQTYETVSKWVAGHQTLTAGIAGALVMFLGVSIAWWQLNSVRRTRYAELLLRVTEIWNSDPYVESRYLIDQALGQAATEEQGKRRLSQKLQESDRKGEKDYFVLIRAPSLLETVALLAEEKYLPLRDARSLLGQPIRFYYKRFSTYIEEMQSKKSTEETYKLLQRLAGRLEDK